METSMPLSIIRLMPYVPAKDFEVSKRFFVSLGFTLSEGWGNSADFALNGYAFRLQNHYVQDWASNFIFLIDVDDVEAWHQRALELLNSKAIPSMRVKVPEPVDDSLVLHVWDPTGVLLVFVQ
jgi:hypothetical protein